MSVSLVIILLVLILSFMFGIRANKGVEMNLEQWTVGGRGFGTIFVFLLTAGEIYTTFTFLGASGWAYQKGAPAYYVIAYMVLAYALSYWLLPPIWKYAREHKLISQSDFFVSKYQSPYLGVLVALIGVLAIIPYIVLQFKGLGIIVSETSYGFISPTVAIVIGMLAVTVYVMASGIHGSAWIATIKDVLIFFVVVFLGLYLPFHYFGGIQPMFEAVEVAKPGFLKLPEQGLNTSWFISTVLLSAVGFYMWPHGYGPVYSAKNEQVFRRNAVFLPLYTLILLFVFFVGHTASVVVPGLKGAASDLSLLRLSIQTFDPWIVGLIGAAGLLTALVPGSMLLMAAATLLMKNVFKVFVPSVSEEQVIKRTKWLVPVIALISLYYTLYGGDTIVTLLLMGYSLVTQLFPALVCSLGTRTIVTKQGAACGMVAGVGVVVYTTATKTTLGTLFPAWSPMLQGVNMGLVALLINGAVMLLISVLTRSLVTTREEQVEQASANG